MKVVFGLMNILSKEFLNNKHNINIYATQDTGQIYTGYLICLDHFRLERKSERFSRAIMISVAMISRTSIYQQSLSYKEFWPQLDSKH